MRTPRWWNPPSWNYHGRRWSDEKSSSRFGMTRRVLLAMWPFAAMAAAASVVIVSMFALVSLFDQRDAAKIAAESAAIAAERAAAAATDTQRILLAQASQAKVDAAARLVAVAAVRADTIAALADHDRSVRNELDDVLARLSRLLGRPVPPLSVPAPTSPATVPAPPAAAGSPSPTSSPVPAPPPPLPTTTTTCPRLPNGKCRP